MLTRARDALLDASIVFSFDRSGFRRHARAFRPGDLDANCSGRVCLVTGANSGIGRATALELARRGARVWLLCRSEERGLGAETALRRESGNGDVHFASLDVASLASVRDFAERFGDERVDLLVHNAGALPAALGSTAEGIELTLATHVVGPFLLTRLLEGRLRAAAGARVLFVSSGGMYPVRLSCRDLGWEARPFDGIGAYAQAKRMQVVLASLFAERWRESGVCFHAMHPGWADTPALRTSIPRFWRATRGILRSPEQGADTVVWLALAAEPARSNGGFWFDRRRAPAHLLPFTRETEDERERLWRTCHELSRRSSEPTRRSEAELSRSRPGAGRAG